MRSARWIMIILLVIASRGCSCTRTINGDDGDGGAVTNGDGGNLTGTIQVSPADVTLDVTVGGAKPTQKFTARGTAGADVTADAVWTVDDQSFGSFSGNTFTPSAVRGGTGRVRANYRGAFGTATVHVRLHAGITDTCPGCPPFPPRTTPACPAARNPRVIYPNDGVLLPPNLNVIETQFDPGTGNKLFEVSFDNAVIDIRVETRCNAIADTRGLNTSGCAYDLDQRVWNFVSQSNRGGDAVKITVRATDDAASCVATSASTAMLFAEKDLNGGIYYWQSVVLGGVQGRTGGIYRHDFGTRDPASEAFLTPGMSNTCIGCHFLSRDGQKMTFGADDADADDEYADVRSLLVDVGSKRTAAGQRSPGFQTFSPDHKLILASDGHGASNPPSFLLFDGETGNAANPPKVPTGPARGTHPDWSPDGRNIVFVQPKMFLDNGGFGSRGDDDHFIGGSLLTLPFDAKNNLFGAPVALLTSQGENNFYPAYSPDGAYIVFNRVPAMGQALDQDAFSNLQARVLLIAAKTGAKPIDLPNLNGQGALTNSWPRWSPFIQQYKGHKLVWVTFSSTRDYGDKVRNSNKVDNGKGQIVEQVNCFPPASPQNPSGSRSDPLAPNCHQPQIWMAGIDLTLADSNVDVGTGDPSFPAFWLPIQDVKAHNHIAQWVSTIVNQPNPDGPCVPLGGMCAAGSAQCCNGVCIGNMCALP